MSSFLTSPFHRHAADRPGDPEITSKSRRRAIVAGVAGVSAIGGAGVGSIMNPPQAAAASIPAQDLATALGFWPVLSGTAPETPSQYGVPVFWVPRAGTATVTTATPLEPAWNDSAGTYTIPSNLAGVQYQDGTGTVLAPGAVLSAPIPLPSQVTVNSAALPGYVLPGAFTWTHTFPNPNQRTLLASDDFTGTTNTPLNNRALNNGVGGTASMTWVPNGTGTYFTIKNNSIVNTGTLGWYKVQTAARNHRLTLDLRWLKPDAKTTTMPFVLSIGGGGGTSANFGAASLSIGQNRWSLTYLNGAGTQTSIAGRSAKMATGTYIVEIFESRIGVQFPGASTLTYYSVPYIDPTQGLPDSSRGGLITLRTVGTYASAPTAIDNVKIESIGGI